MTTIYHNHHIVPKHMGGTDDPSNLIRLSVEEHAEAHRKLYEKHGNIEDYLAWKGLLGIIPKQEIVEKVTKMGYLKASKIRTERYHSDPEWAAEIRKKQSKPKSRTENYFGPKSETHKENMRKTALKRERFPCSKCGNGYTKANLVKHEKACNGKPKS